MSDDTTTDSTQPTDGGGKQRVEDRDTFLAKLLTGRADVDFIGRSRTWLLITVAVLAVSLLALFARGLNFSIEFTGGSQFTVREAAQPIDPDALQAAVEALGVSEVVPQVVGDGEGAIIRTPAINEIASVDEFDVRAVIEEETGGIVELSTVGPSWGDRVSTQALEGLIVFLGLVIAYISFRFEWRMAISAVITLAHDVVATIGLYALAGFNVSTSTVIALLTILGYSLYDTVVVFDRITEDAEKLTSVSSVSYGEVANGALNNVLVRSMSTSITSVLPVASLLIIGANLLGAATLSDLALALFIGMTIGTYSSIIIAAPLLVWLKEKDPKFAELKQRAEARA